MDLREFLKHRLLDFLLIQAGITLAMGVIGCVTRPAGLPHTILFMPFVYAFFCTLPGFVTYSARELSIRAMAFRKVLEFLLDEAAALAVAYFTGVLVNGVLTAAIAVSVLVIFLLVDWIGYLASRADAEAMTRKLHALQAKEEELE